MLAVNRFSVNKKRRDTAALFAFYLRVASLVVVVDFSGCVLFCTCSRSGRSFRLLNVYPISFHCAITSPKIWAFVSDVEWRSAISPGCVREIIFFIELEGFGCSPSTQSVSYTHLAR